MLGDDDVNQFHKFPEILQSSLSQYTSLNAMEVREGIMTSPELALQNIVTLPYKLCTSML